MTEQEPLAILAEPPSRIAAFISGRPMKQIMGVAIDADTGDHLQAVILPTKQRVMLALGIGDKKAHAHNIYRQKYPKGYTLFWTDDPEHDPRLARAKDKTLARASLEHGIQAELGPKRPAHRSVAGIVKNASDITAELVRSGAESVEQPIAASAAAGLPGTSAKDFEQGNREPVEVPGDASADEPADKGGFW